MLAVLIGLGTWQVERLAWKTNLLNQLAQAEARPAELLPADPSPFVRVRVEGRLRNDLAALYGAEGRETAQGPQMGGQQIVPMERPGADPILVDRGWVPDRRPMPAATGTVVVEGYVRPAEHAGWFSAKDDPQARRFYTLDPQAIGAALGLARVAPFTLVAVGSAPPELYPDPARHLPRPPNNHLSYAITWYGLAVALVVIFVLYVRKAARE
nr:SURF1 family protein [Limobrevibacterium gyesilva]